MVPVRNENVILMGDCKSIKLQCISLFSPLIIQNPRKVRDSGQVTSETRGSPV